MIGVVRMQISPEMERAMKAAQERDRPLREALADMVHDSLIGTTLEVTADEAEDWCESWFDPEDLDGMLTAGHDIDVEYPDFCDEPLLKAFVQAVFKIYRLTESV